MGKCERLVLVLALTGAILGPDPMPTASAQEPLSPAELGDDTPPLVAPGWLAHHLMDPEVAILDARPDIRDYQQEHILGAQRLVFENLTSSAGGIPGQIHEIETIERIVGSWASDNTRTSSYTGPGAMSTQPSSHLFSEAQDSRGSRSSMAASRDGWRETDVGLCA